MRAEQVIFFAGPQGAGKTTAISSASDIPLESLGARATPGSAIVECGRVALPEGGYARLYGIETGCRLANLWRMADSSAVGLVLLIDDSALDPLADFDHYLNKFGAFYARSAGIVGVTRTDVTRASGVDRYRRRLRERLAFFPIFEVDARDRAQVIALLTTLSGMLQHRALAAGTG